MVHRRQPPSPTWEGLRRVEGRPPPPAPPGFARLLLPAAATGEGREELGMRKARVSPLNRPRGDDPGAKRSLSFDYRLAPEHRLPAAHEDAATALLWLRGELIASVNPWLAECADSRRVFVSGVSAGGSLSHHMAVRFGTAGLEPAANVVGYILLMPGLFSAEPTRSELDTPDSALLTQEMFDRFFRLGMPVRATRDHPLMNPFDPDSPSREPARVGRMLVVAAELDFFRDRNVGYAERMKAMGKDVELVVFAGQDHGFFGMDPASDADRELVRVMKRFVGRDVDENLDEV